ncbi:MAG TPA: phytanoyl-CoA dioxygenase family protein [Puia sp.]|nr:phytanoyl-CoA dioxygenase family protein [Puia sp.]
MEIDVHDLSHIHHLIDDLFSWPESPGEWEQYRLTGDQVDFFRENGYLAGVKMLDERQIEAIKKELGELMNPGNELNPLFYEFHTNESADENTILFHALGAWRIGTALHDVLWNPRFVMASSQLLGNASVRFWHDQLFCKPPKKGGVVAWHQDYSYWTRTKPLAHLTCWCGLDDSTVENGCLRYVPGSHRWGLLDKPQLAGDLMGIMDFLTPEQQTEFHPVPVETKAGEAIFHHPLMLHGSGENKSSQPRRAFVINVFADGVYADSTEALLTGVPPFKKGEKITGQFFPLLFKADGDPMTESRN